MDFLTALDNEILWLIKSTFSGQFFKGLWLTVYRMSFLGIGWFALSLVLIVKQKRRYIGTAIVFALLAGFLVSYVASNYAIRLPPYYLDSDIELIVKTFNKHFPSFSTVMSFSAAVALSRLWRQFSSIFIFCACMVAVSHLYLMLCYPTDIIISIFLGLIAGWAVGKIAHRCIPSKIKI